MSIRSAGRLGLDSLLKLFGLLFTAIGLLIVYSTWTSLGQLYEGRWVFLLIGFLLGGLGLFLLLARTQ